MTKPLGLAPRSRSRATTHPRIDATPANDDSLVQGANVRSGATPAPVATAPQSDATPDAPLTFGRRVEVAKRRAVTHDLKCWWPYFQDVQDGHKTFEVRKNDRDYREGDTLCLREWDPVTSQYSGRSLRVRVTYLLKGAPGMPEDMCVMGIEVAN